MATVNVYTYYTHKLAHEKMPRPKPAARRLAWPRLHPVWALLLLAWVWLRWMPPAQPLAACSGSLLALAALYGLSRLTIRSQKVWRALNGMSLGADDLEVLCGR